MPHAAATGCGLSCCGTALVPEITGVLLTHTHARVEDTLACTPVGFSDPDSDDDQSLFDWTVNDVGAGSNPTLSGAFVRGGTVRCTITPPDGTDGGAPLDDAVTIANRPPVVSEVTVTPELPTVDTPLTCIYWLVVAPRGSGPSRWWSRS